MNESAAVGSAGSKASTVEKLLLLSHLIGAVSVALGAIAQAIRLSQKGELWNNTDQAQEKTSSAYSINSRVARESPQSLECLRVMAYEAAAV